MLAASGPTSIFLVIPPTATTTLLPPSSSSPLYLLFYKIKPKTAIDSNSFLLSSSDKIVMSAANAVAVDAAAFLTTTTTIVDEHTIKPVKLREFTLRELVMNHGLVTIIGFCLLTLLSLTAIAFFLSAKHVRKGAGQILFFLYSITIAVIALIMMLGFYHPPLSQSPETRMSCVAVSVATHVLILFSFGILTCYGVHLVYRARSFGQLPNMFVIKSVFPTAGISIALPIALSALRPNDYVDNFACCFPHSEVANFAIFLPMALSTLSNFIILALFPCLYAPPSSSGRKKCCFCCERSTSNNNNDSKLDWSPVYKQEQTDDTTNNNRTNSIISSEMPVNCIEDDNQQQNIIECEMMAMKGRPSCLHALAVIGLGFLEGGSLIMFYVTNFLIESIDPNAPPSTNPETRSYSVGFLVMTFLLGISLVLEMATLEDESLKACKMCCLGADSIGSRDEDGYQPTIYIPTTGDVIPPPVTKQPSASNDVRFNNNKFCLTAPVQRNQISSKSLPQLNMNDSEDGDDENVITNGQVFLNKMPTSRLHPQSSVTLTTLPRRAPLLGACQSANFLKGVTSTTDDEVYDNLPIPPPRARSLTANQFLSRSAKMLGNVDASSGPFTLALEPLVPRHHHHHHQHQQPSFYDFPTQQQQQQQQQVTYRGEQCYYHPPGSYHYCNSGWLTCTNCSAPIPNYAHFCYSPPPPQKNPTTTTVDCHNTTTTTPERYVIQPNNNDNACYCSHHQDNNLYPFARNALPPRTLPVASCNNFSYGNSYKPH